VASKSLVKWLKMLWENWRASVLTRLARLLRRGSSSSFYRPRRERITCIPRYLATWGGVVCYAVE
jgi:hypothetical protein